MLRTSQRAETDYSIQLQRYGLDDWGILVRLPTAVRFFNAQTGFDTYQASYTVVSYQGHFSGDMRPQREAAHTHPAKVEVMNERSYTSTPPTRIHGVHGEDFTFHFSILKYKLL